MHGPTVDDQTRCVHYATVLDVVALRFWCCDRYFPCHLCHATSSDHEAVPWPVAERARPAVLCGVCRGELSVDEYLGCGSTCPRCGAAFNPGCARHADLYFEPAPTPWPAGRSVL
ncbi:CHY zinc finger protein [Sediminihabitans luteus]|uniref:CHY zinc finger protein n=1 Tax=Sediminihabitans luteus TaxID=1138585 RepID=UPI001EF20368|nr:CHY zinc finger protein [Sediminihabitans luteus]